MSNAPAPTDGSPIEPAELDRLRAQLPAVQPTVYLNAGTLGPLPLVAIDAMAAEHRVDAEQRQCARLWERLAGRQAAARVALASLIGVGVEQVALMHTTHEGINTALWGLGATSGDNVVTTAEEHPGLLVPLRHLRDRLGVEVRIAPWENDDDRFVEALLRSVDARTRAVVLSHVSWVSGRTAPLRLLRDALPASCRLIVDGAQSAGAMATDPVSDGWDAYTVSGQKWPCGPNGTGGLALVDPTAWEPTFGAFPHVTDYADCLGSPLVPDGRRFETSQESMTPLVGFTASVDWLVETVGVSRAQEHSRWLNCLARGAFAPLLEQVGCEPGSSMHGDAQLLCVDLPEGTALGVIDGLWERGFMARSLSPSRLRLSLGFWNTEDEVRRSVDAVGELLLG